MSRKNRPNGFSVSPDQVLGLERGPPPGAEPPRVWPADPMERIQAWVRHSYQPTEIEALQVGFALYSPIADITHILKEIRIMSTKLDALTAQVAASNTIAESAITLITGLKTELDAAIAADDDGDSLQALSDSLGAESTKLAAAVTANTPAAPTSTDPSTGTTGATTDPSSTTSTDPGTATDNPTAAAAVSRKASKSAG